MNLQLENKLCLVTGSTAGIGLAIARSLAAEGARVVINGRTDKRVAEAIAEIKQTVPAAKLESLAADLSKADAAEQVAKRFPELDVVVNNLGIFEPKAFGDITDADWSKFIETNFMSGVRLARHFLPKMIAKNWGRIIFISSESGVNIPVEMIHYGVTKTMQIALSRGLAEMTIRTAVTVNTVLPGPTNSEGVGTFVTDLAKSRGISNQQMEQEFFQSARPSSLLQRFATTDEIASMVTYVASPLSAATNGAALRVDGGLLRSIL